jgi:hypothetical protein
MAVREDIENRKIAFWLIFGKLPILAALVGAVGMVVYTFNDLNWTLYAAGQLAQHTFIFYVMMPLFGATTPDQIGYYGDWAVNLNEFWELNKYLPWFELARTVTITSLWKGALIGMVIYYIAITIILNPSILWRFIAGKQKKSLERNNG